MAQRDYSAYRFAVWEAKVRRGLIPDHGISDFSNKSDNGLRVVRQKPNKAIFASYGIIVDVEDAKVDEISTRVRVDGGWFVENSSETVGEWHDRG